MTCKELILDLLADYLDQSLSAAACLEVEDHLRECEACAAYLRTYEKTRELTRRAGEVEMPAEMKRRLREFLLKQLS